MRTIFPLLVILLLFGCASSPIQVADYKKTTNVNYPNMGETVTLGIGESLVRKGVRTTGPALEIVEVTQFNKSEGESSIMTCAVTVMPASVFKKGIYQTSSTQADCYGPISYQLTLSDGTTNWNCPGSMGSGDICRDVNGEYFLAIVAAKVKLKQDHDNIRLIEKAVEHQTNFIQELIYNGRVGNNLKFIYREFSNDLIRPAFTQEVQYDLSESDIIGFKHLRLKIIEASNIEITYILERTF